MVELERTCEEVDATGKTVAGPAAAAAAAELSSGSPLVLQHETAIILFSQA